MCLLFLFFFFIHRVPAILNRESAEMQSKQRATEWHWNPLRSRPSAPAPSRRQEHPTWNDQSVAEGEHIVRRWKANKGPKIRQRCGLFLCGPAGFNSDVHLFSDSERPSVQMLYLCTKADRMLETSIYCVIKPHGNRLYQWPAVKNVIFKGPVCQI